MDIIKEIDAEPEHIGSLVEGIMKKLLPRQLHEHISLGYDDPISKVAEFIALTGFPYKPNGAVNQEFRGMFKGAFTKWVMENAEGKWSGYHEPLRCALDVPKWGIIAKQLSIPVEFDQDYFPISNFEFFHYDYKNELSSNLSNSDFPTLDLIYAGQLYDFEQHLRQQQPNNPYYRKCDERASRKATEEDIDNYIEEIERRELAHLILAHPEDYGVDMSFLTPDGTILYLYNAPQPPRKAHSPEEIKGYLSEGVERAAANYCGEQRYTNAVNLLVRRNRVKDFLGSDIEIPQPLVEHHRNFLGGFNPEGIRERIKQRVISYSPRSLSYGLDLPEDFTFAEYCFLRYMEAFVELSRSGTLLYDTPEKQGLINGVELGKIPIATLKLGYREAKSFERFGSPR